MNKQTPQGEHTCTHIDCNDPHCEYSKNEIKKRTLRYSALPPQGDSPIDSIKETPTPNKQANELARKAGEKAEKAIDKERLEILWNERQGDSPKNETEKCYLEHVDGYLTCTYNHTIGALCLGNMCKYCGELECKCYDSPKENIEEIVKSVYPETPLTDNDFVIEAFEKKRKELETKLTTFKKQTEERVKKEIVEWVEKNKTDSADLFCDAVATENLLDHLNNK